MKINRPSQAEEDYRRQFETARQTRDRYFGFYQEALERGDHENAADWYTHFEAARVDRMRRTKTPDG